MPDIRELSTAMRLVLPLLLLGTATPLPAQQTIAGVAIDSVTGAPLRCMDVSVRDSAGNVLARTQTASDGSFRLQPGAGAQRLEFAVWRRTPVKREIPPIDSSGAPRSYALAFEAAATLESSNKTWERSVVDFLREIRYEPARRDGQPVCALEYATPFSFNARP